MTNDRNPFGRIFCGLFSISPQNFLQGCHKGNIFIPFMTNHRNPIGRIFCGMEGCHKGKMNGA